MALVQWILVILRLICGSSDFLIAVIIDKAFVQSLGHRVGGEVGGW